MSENNKNIVLETETQKEFSENVNVGCNNTNDTKQTKADDINIGSNIDNSYNNNKSKDNKKNKKSNTKKNIFNNKPNKEYNIKENADKINEMIKRFWHFGFGLFFLFMSSIFPLFFIFALGSFTMAIVGNEIINDMLNSDNSIIKFCARTCMLPELVVSGVKRGVLWNDGNMFTGLLTGGKIEYKQNKGVTYNTVEGTLESIASESKNKNNKISNVESKTKDTEIPIGYKNKKQNKENTKSTKDKELDKNIIKNSSKSNSEYEGQIKDSSSSLNSISVDAKSSDSFSIKDDVSIESFPESKSSKSYKPSLRSTSSSSVDAHTTNSFNNTKSIESSNTADKNSTKYKNEQLTKSSQNFENVIEDINDGMNSSRGTVSRFSGK